MAEILFANTKNYSFFHSAQVITEATIQALKSEVPGISDFIKSRFKASKHLRECFNKINARVSFKQKLKKG